MKTCPICKNEYEPVLTSKHPEMLIQQEFPNAESWEREQLISGICSDFCWDKLFYEEED